MTTSTSPRAWMTRLLFILITSGFVINLYSISTSLPKNVNNESCGTFTLPGNRTQYQEHNGTTMIPSQPIPLQWKHTIVNWTKGTKMTHSKRGIVLLRATNVPIPDVYQKSYGPKGKPHDKLILELISSIRKFSAMLPVVVVVDEEPELELSKIIDGYIKVNFHNELSNKDAKAWREKIPALLESPFDENLYMDSDMKICHDIEPLYGILRSNEMGFVRTIPQAEPKTWNRNSYAYDYYGCFILYKKTEQVHKLLKKAMTYDMPDQNALNQALQEASANELPHIFTFPAATLAVCRPNDLVLPVIGPIYTIHGVSAQCGNINSHLGSRYLRCYGTPNTVRMFNYTNVHELVIKHQSELAA